MTITVTELRAGIIQPALQAIGLWSPAAEDLLLGTAIQESRLKWTRQLGGGPALGYWQMEPATHYDIWQSYLKFRPQLFSRVLALLPDPSVEPTPPLLETNHRYACAMARIRYARSPMPLPEHGDIAGYAHMWKVVYNTAGGKGTEQEFIDHWNDFMWRGQSQPQASAAE